MWHNQHVHPHTGVSGDTLPNDGLMKSGLLRIPEFKRLTGLALFSVGLASSVASADPSVDGTVISWPDDGWYQVQTSNGATTLCNGGNSCTVAPGSYLVINHTSGIRYTDVRVGRAQSADDIQVSGNTISWPDAGWFQVQSMDGRTNYCNGGSSCDVEPGVYRVINHTTGERFDNIAVNTDPVASGITVNAQRISWPDDGWYQVQSSDGGTTLCNGGSYCDVQPGTYLVINHTTGMRFPGMEVMAEEPANEPAALINRDNHVDMLTQVFSVYTGAIYGDTLSGIPQQFMDSREPTELEVSEVMLGGQEHGIRYEYVCDNGGTMEYLVRLGNLENTNRLFTWDDCFHIDATRDGTLSSADNSYGSYTRYLIASDYTVEYANGEQVDVSGKYGETSQSFINPSIRRIDRWSHDGFDYLLQNESAVLEVGHASTDLSYTWLEQADDVFTAVLEGSFQLNSPLTGHHAISVATSEALSVSVTLDGSFDYIDILPSTYYPDYPEWAFTRGVLELSAEDGSTLRLEADSDDVHTARITLLQNEVVLETFQQPWSLWSDVLTSVKMDPRDL